MIRSYETLRRELEGISPEFIRDIAHSSRFTCTVFVLAGSIFAAGAKTAIPHHLALVIVCGVVALIFLGLAVLEGVLACRIYRVADHAEMVRSSSPRIGF